MSEISRSNVVTDQAPCDVRILDRRELAIRGAEQLLEKCARVRVVIDQQDAGHVYETS
jgi:hypothetical protein